MLRENIDKNKPIEGTSLSTDLCKKLTMKK